MFAINKQHFKKKNKNYCVLWKDSESIFQQWSVFVFTCHLFTNHLCWDPQCTEESELLHGLQKPKDDEKTTTDNKYFVQEPFPPQKNTEESHLLSKRHKNIKILTKKGA